jgi:hypothetical protein
MHRAVTLTSTLVGSVLQVSYIEDSKAGANVEDLLGMAGGR